MKKSVPLDMQPGLLTLTTDTDAKNRWKDGNHVRFYRGLVRKIGGWVKNTSSSFIGVARTAIDWRALSAAHIIAFGTNLKLYVFTSAAFTDITPLADSGTLANNPFTTVNASALVTVHDAAHARVIGDYVRFGGATAVGGITINGEYTVTSVTGVDDYVITHSIVASSGASGGGAAVTYSYDISPGAASSSGGLGWGVGAWNAGTWNTAHTSSILISYARMWALDNWGEDLIANPRDGAIYVWDTSGGIVANRATQIGGTCPVTAKSIMVSELDRHLIAFGAHDGSVSDALLIRWSASEDYTDWLATALNDAGRKRLDGGNEIYGAIKVDKEILVHTDSTFYSMRFVGPPDTFDFASKGSNGNLVGPNAMRAFDGRGWWMGKNDFFEYNGRQHVLPCDVRNRVFDNLNVGQATKVFAGSNLAYGEVWWLYPSLTATECDSYVIYNVWEKHWSLGTLDRSVIIGDSTIFGPYGLSPAGFLYDHEVGVDDDASALIASLSSWDMEIGEGDRVMHVSKLVPNFKRLIGSVQASFTGKAEPQSAETESETVSQLITSSTEYLDTHMRARQVSLTLETTALGDDFHMGKLHLHMAAAGKRP